MSLSRKVGRWRSLPDSTVLSNVGPSGTDIYKLGALSLDNSASGVIGP